MINVDTILSRLADFEPSPFPVLSLYLRADRDNSGHDRFVEFARKHLTRKAKTYAIGTDERNSYDKDQERILELLESEDEDVRPAGESVAIFACHGEELFEVVELDAELQTSRLIVGAKPDLFPLAWINERFARYAVVVADSQSARLFVFGLGSVVDEEEVDGESVRRQKNGGWSQARFQRRRQNAKLENIRETLDSLGQLVKDEGVTSIILVGDNETVAQIREELPQQLAELVEDESLRLARDAPQHKILEETLAVFLAADDAEDEERARELLGEYRADGLACVGLGDTLDAVIQGRAEEVLMRGSASDIAVDSLSKVGHATLSAQSSGDDADTREVSAKVADLLVTQAEKTGATVRFLETETALSEVGGVGAFLRYRI